MLSKELIKICRKERKATICIKIKGVLYPIDNVEFSYSNDGNIYITLEPDDSLGNIK